MLKPEVPQGIEKHHHDGDREKYKDDNPNNDTRNRRQGDWHNEGDQQARGYKADDGKEDAENVGAACLSRLQRDMGK